jgi:hypothetical protein
MQLKTPKKNIAFAPLLLGLIILIYISIRITTVCFSIDEYMSYTEHVAGTWWDALRINNHRTGWIANNHILNTLCMKFEFQFIGNKDWMLRLHLPISFVIGFWYGYKLIQLLSPSVIRQTIYLMILFFNPFLLDFYGLARGYALSFSAIIAAVYYLLQYKNTLHFSYLLYLCIALFLGFFASFSAIYYYPMFIAAVCVICYQQQHLVPAMQHVGFMLLFIAITIGIHIPQLQITQESFYLIQHHSGIFTACVKEYVDKYIHHNPYINRHFILSNGWKLTSVIGFIIFTAWFIMQCIAFSIAKKQYAYVVLKYCLISLVTITCFAKVLFLVKNTPIPSGRIQIIFSIPFYLGICAALEIIVHKWRKTIFVLYGIASFLIWHFVSAFNLTQSIEWWNVGDAKKVTAFIAKDATPLNKNKPILIGAENNEFHSLAFYVQTQLADVAIIEWTDLNNPKKFDYLVVNNAEANNVTKEFTLYKKMDRCSIFVPVSK